MLLSRFWHNARGGIAPLMAFVMIPLMTAVGIAIDFGRASAARSAFQTSLDSAALKLSKTAATANASTLESDATTMVAALFNRSGVSTPVVTASFTSAGGSKIVLKGTSSVATNFLSFLGYDSIPISASTTAVWGNTRLRVALVLDNTGSMAQSGKMTALKTASHNLLTQLQSCGERRPRTSTCRSSPSARM